MRPRCCLRYLTFFGINIKSVLSSQLSVLSRSCVSTSAICPLTSNLLERSRRAHFPCRSSFALLRRENLALIDPALHADHAIGRARLGEAVVNVRAQRVQRQPPLQIPLRPRDFIAIQPPAYPHLDALATEAQRRIHRLAHLPPEAHSLFQLQRNRLRYQLRIELRLVHFLDIDMHFARRALLQVLLQHHVFVILRDKPARLPRLGVTEPESVRMNLLSHVCS